MGSAYLISLIMSASHEDISTLFLPKAFLSLHRNILSVTALLGRSSSLRLRIWLWKVWLSPVDILTRLCSQNCSKRRLEKHPLPIEEKA